MTWWAFLLLLGACARLCRLIGTDKIMGRIRARATIVDGWFTKRLFKRLGLPVPSARYGNGPILTLMTCPWCLSMWIASALVYVEHLARGDLRTVFFGGCTALSISQLTGLTARLDA